MDSVRNQYEQFPYPPIPFFALPRADQGSDLSFKRAQKRLDHLGGSPSPKILVVGCGTFEPLVTAQANPEAQVITCLDVSEASIRRLKNRVRLAKMLRPRFPAFQFAAEDLRSWNPPETYDFITATQVLHHLEDPASALARLGSWLNPGGLLRIVTYPKASRLWMRAASRWIKSRGLNAQSPDLRKRARDVMRRLPHSSPVRTCFETHPEIGTQAGLIDAFFHACENPLSPLEWAKAIATAGLEVVGESQNFFSQSAFLSDIIPETRHLTRFERLELLDLSLELCHSPVLWMKKTTSEAAFEDYPLPYVTEELGLPSAIDSLIARIEALLLVHRISTDAFFEALKTKAGPQVSPIPPHAPLKGHSLWEYWDDRQLFQLLWSSQ